MCLPLLHPNTPPPVYSTTAAAAAAAAAGDDVMGGDLLLSQTAMTPRRDASRDSRLIFDCCVTVTSRTSASDVI